MYNLKLLHDEFTVCLATLKVSSLLDHHHILILILIRTFTLDYLLLDNNFHSYPRARTTLSFITIFLHIYLSSVDIL